MSLGSLSQNLHNNVLLTLEERLIMNILIYFCAEHLLLLNTIQKVTRL